MRVIEERKPVYDIEQAIERPDGSRIIVSINASPYVVDSGPILDVVLIRKSFNQNFTNLFIRQYLQLLMGNITLTQGFCNPPICHP